MWYLQNSPLLLQDWLPPGSPTFQPELHGGGNSGPCSETHKETTFPQLTVRPNVWLSARLKGHWDTLNTSEFIHSKTHNTHRLPFYSCCSDVYEPWREFQVDHMFPISALLFRHLGCNQAGPRPD